MTTPLIILSCLFILSQWCTIAQQQDELLLHLDSQLLQRNYLKQDQQYSSSLSSSASIPHIINPNKPKISIQDGKLYYNNIIYDFRPAFPPYTMEKLNELLILQDREQQQQQQQEEENDALDSDTMNGPVDSDGKLAMNGTDNEDFVVDAVDNITEEDASIDRRRHNSYETITEEGRGQEETTSLSASMTDNSSNVQESILTEDIMSSLHENNHEIIADGNTGAVISDIENEADEIINDSITSGTSEAMADSAADENLVKVAAAIFDVQDDGLERDMEENDQNYLSADKISIENSNSSNDVETVASDSSTEDTSSTTGTFAALFDPEGEYSKGPTILELDSVSPPVGKTNDDTQTSTLIEGEQEKDGKDNRTLDNGKEEALLVTSEYMSVDEADDDEQDSMGSAKQEEGENAELVFAEEGDVDVNNIQTIQSFSANDDESMSNPIKSTIVDNKDANRQFVDGLDELDKLFEPVEVPDELDVGADGTSMQEVLVGQGLKILWKNVKRVLFSLAGDRNSKDKEMLLEEDSIVIRGDGDISVSFDSSILDSKGKHQHGHHKDNTILTKSRSSTGTNEEGELFREKGKKLLPITMKVPQTQKILKYARRKFEHVKHILGDLLSIFEGTGYDDDDDELKLFDAIGLDVRQSVEAAKATASLLGGRGGQDGAGGKDPTLAYEIDETFLKSRFEAMKTGTASGDPVE